MNINIDILRGHMQVQIDKRVAALRQEGGVRQGERLADRCTFDETVVDEQDEHELLRATYRCTHKKQKRSVYSTTKR